MISFEGVSKSYGQLTAIDRISLEIPDNHFCVIVGPSGGGKSTLLRMINHLVVPSSGSVRLNDRLVSSFRLEELRRGIGYVIQNVGLFPHLTVARNIAVVPRLLHWSPARINDRVDELLEMVGLAPAVFRNRSPQALSGGEAQRVGVARALAADPPVLLMDEPFSAVDPVTRVRLQTEFLAIQQNLRKTVVFVTHDVDEAIRMADVVAVVKNGKLVQYATPRELLEQPADAFVTGFIGSDRALKRLSLFRVRDYQRMANPIVWHERSVRHASTTRFQWVTDGQGRLLGSIDCRELAACSDELDGFMAQDVLAMSVRPDYSLKEALSVMIGTGSRTLAVVDAAFTLLGEISLSDIEAVSEQHQ